MAIEEPTIEQKVDFSVGAAIPHLEGVLQELKRRRDPASLHNAADVLLIAASIFRDGANAVHFKGNR